VIFFIPSILIVVGTILITVGTIIPISGKNDLILSLLFIDIYEKHIYFFVGTIVRGKN
jgi:hypothetical protein